MIPDELYNAISLTYVCLARGARWCLNTLATLTESAH